MSVVPDTAVDYCAWCLLPDCTREHGECSPPPRRFVADELVGAATGAVCVCDRPMPLEDGCCLKCGRPVEGAGHG